MRLFLTFVRRASLVACLAAAAAAQSRRLSLPLPAGSAVRDFRVADDGRSVVFLAPSGANPFPLNLFVADVLRPAAPRLLDSRSCLELELDGKRAVYTRAEGTSVVLSSVTLGGGDAPVELGPGTAPEVGAEGTVVFTRGGRLHRVPADGSAAAVQIHSASVHHQWRLSPDGKRVLFVTPGSIDFSSWYGHLYSAPLDGSTPPVALNTPANPAETSSFAASADSRWVVFRRVVAGTQLSNRLMRAPIDGSAPAAALHAPLPAGANVESFHAYTTPRFTPDGARVVFKVEQEVADLYELYSAPLDGSAPAVRLNDEVNRFVWMHRVSPEGARVVYLASAASFADPFELLWVPVDGSAPPQRIGEPLEPGATGFTFSIAPDGQSVAYVVQRSLPVPRNEVRWAPMLGGPSRRLCDEDQSCAVGSADQLQFALRGEAVVFPAYRIGGTQPLELFAARPDGRAPLRRLSNPMVAGGNLIGLDPFFHSLSGALAARFAAGDSIALFRADSDKNDVFELWAAPLALERVAR